MVHALAQNRVQRQPAATVGGRPGEHREEFRPTHMEGTGRTDEPAAWCQEAHRPAIHLVVPAQGGRDAGLALRERRRVDHDHIEAAALAPPRREDVEGIAGDEVDLAETIEGGVFRPAGERLGRDVERGHGGGALRQVERKGAMVGEAVERGPTRGDE